MKRSLRPLMLAAGLASAFTGCVDTSEIDYHPPVQSTPDAGMLPDGGQGGVDPALVEECRACMTTGACAEAYAPCDLNTTCRSLIQCTLDAYCLNYDAADLAHLPTCLTDCAVVAHISSQDDPSVPLIAAVTICSKDNSKCAPVCNVGVHKGSATAL